VSASPQRAPADRVSSVYRSRVFHARQTPIRHSFRNEVCWYLIDLDELPMLERELAPVFAVDAGRSRLVTLDTSRHLITESGDGMRDRVASCLARLNADGFELGRVLLYTNLGVAGYTFAPASLWFCHDERDELRSIIVEVNNTYGEQHPYVLRAQDQDPARPGRWRGHFDKQFHVSPFHGLDMEYDIEVVPPSPRGQRTRGEPIRLLVRARYLDGRPPFIASIEGTREPLTRRSLLHMQLRYPLLPQRVIVLIHLQALRLWLRKARFNPKPPFTPQEGSRAAAGTDTAADAGTEPAAGTAADADAVDAHAHGRSGKEASSGIVD
jgi:DUF1365 family protein